MNNQERQALIEWLQGEKSVSYQQNVKFIRLAREIALAALTENWQELASKWKEEAIRAHEEADDLHEQLKELAKQKAVAWVPQSQIDLLKKYRIVEADLSAMQRFDEVPLFTHASPSAPLVVKLPKKRRIAYYPGHSLKAVYREEYNALEIIEAIKAAGGSVE